MIELSYHETLSRIIKNSGLTLRDLSEKCKEEYNLRIDPSYLSKLQSGKQSPASDEVNITIAKVCDADVEELLFEAYMEKAPDSIKLFMKNMINYFRKMTIAMSKAQVPKEIAETYEKIINDTPSWEFVKVMLNEESLKLPEQDGTIFYESDNPEHKNILIAANPLLNIPMPDNSMEPIIPQGAALQLGEVDEIEENDIVLAVIDGKDSVVRRYVLVEDKIILIAENTKFKPIITDKESVVIVGKVKSFIKEL